VSCLFAYILVDGFTLFGDTVMIPEGAEHTAIAG